MRPQRHPESELTRAIPNPQSTETRSGHCCVKSLSLRAPSYRVTNTQYRLGGECAHKRQDRRSCGSAAGALQVAASVSGIPPFRTVCSTASCLPHLNSCMSKLQAFSSKKKPCFSNCLPFPEQLSSTYLLRTSSQRSHCTA